MLVTNLATTMLGPQFVVVTTMPQPASCPRQGGPREDAYGVSCAAWIIEDFANVRVLRQD